MTNGDEVCISRRSSILLAVLMLFHEFFATSISANFYNFRFRLNYRYIIGFCEALFDMLKLDDIGMTGITGIGFGLNDTRLIGCVTLVALGGK